MVSRASVLVAASAAAAALGGVACGPSAAETRAARQSVYQAEVALVWNAVVETVKAEYPRVVVEDPIGGRIMTDWHLIERVNADDTTAATTTPVAPTGTVGQNGLPAVGGKFFRVAVLIKPDGPPWRVEVDGEAALYLPGNALITAYGHEDADEPTWVPTRIDKIRVGIYRRLKAQARHVEAPVKKVASLDTAPWRGLPDGAPEAIAAVHAAAKKKDTRALRGLMVDDFAWSAGGDPSADVAVSLWQADPLLLSELVTTLEDRKSVV